MPKRKLLEAAAALHCVKKKLRSKLPLRRPRRSHSYAFLNDVTHQGRSTSSVSPLLCSDERLLSFSVDDSSRVTVDELFPSTRSVTDYSDRCYDHKRYSEFTSVADVVSESSSCVEPCSAVGDQSAEVIGNRKLVGLSTIRWPAASDFDVTSQEQPLQPQFSVNHLSLERYSDLKSTENYDDGGVSVVDDGGLISPIGLNWSSSEQEAYFSPSFDLDSGTDFSERSVEDTLSLTYSYLLQYRLAFQKSSSPPSAENVPCRHDDSTAWLRLVEDYGEEEWYLSLRSRERRQAYILDYTRQSHSLIKQRFQIVHWIIEQSAKKELQKETMFLGVNLLDRFLSNGNFKNKRNRSLQIAGIACLTLATRIEENQLYNSVQQSTFRMGRNTYSRPEVVAMEWLVQEILNFKCFLPTIYNFLSFYLRLGRADIEMAKNAQHLAELALLEPEQLSYWPSTVAASLVILSSLPNHYLPHIRVMKAHLRSEDENIDECIKSLSLSLNKY